MAFLGNDCDDFMEYGMGLRVFFFGFFPVIMVSCFLFFCFLALRFTVLLIVERGVGDRLAGRLGG